MQCFITVGFSSSITIASETSVISRMPWTLKKTFNKSGFLSTSDNIQIVISKTFRDCSIKIETLSPVKNWCKRADPTDLKLKKVDVSQINLKTSKGRISEGEIKFPLVYDDNWILVLFLISTYITCILTRTTFYCVFPSSVLSAGFNLELVLLMRKRCCVLDWD